MLQIRQFDPPRKFKELRAAGADFPAMSAEPTIRKALRDQQAGRCAYCERPLGDIAMHNHGTRIEHFHPQNSQTWVSDCQRGSGAPDNGAAPTTWTNLLLCCDGNELAGQHFTCDKSKAGRDICGDFRNPKAGSSASLVEIDRQGRAWPTKGLPAGADNVIDTVLNLNDENLVAARFSVLAAWWKAIQRSKTIHHGLTANQRSAWAAKLRVEAETAEFGSTLLSLANHISARKP